MALLSICHPAFCEYSLTGDYSELLALRYWYLRTSRSFVAYDLVLGIERGLFGCSLSSLLETIAKRYTGLSGMVWIAFL